MARQMDKGELQTAWFERHGSTPITEIPTHWPAAYRTLVERRIKLIETNKEIGLIEKPEYKRRWNTEPWAEQEQRALKNWLLDRLEDKRYWPRRRTAIDGTSRRPSQHRRRVHAGGGALPGPTRLRRGRSCGRTGRGRVRPVPADPAVQGHGPAEAGRLGADVGSPAAGGRRGGGRRHPGAAQVRHGGLREDRLLAAAGQARRAQGTLGQLPALLDRQRPVAARRLGRVEPPPAGGGSWSATTTPASGRAGTPNG